MQRVAPQLEHYRTSLTPSKRQKYDNYTPRKRYVKEQEQFGQYRHLSYNDPQNTSPVKHHQDQQYLKRSRNLAHSRKKEQPVTEEQSIYCPPKSRQISTKYDLDSYNISEALEDCSSMINNRPSFRQKRLRKNEDSDMYKKLNMEDIPKRLSLNQGIKKESKQELPKVALNQNIDVSNSNRPRVSRIMDEEPLTPRKIIKHKENMNRPLTQKMTALQTKIAKLEKMTPKRSATPSKNSRQEYIQPYQPCEPAVLFQKEEVKQEVTSISQVTAISQRESELLSRVSLGRLVEQQQAQSEIEVIQDLSYKISSKLQSIIRNFG